MVTHGLARQTSKASLDPELRVLPLTTAKPELSVIVTLAPFQPSPYESLMVKAQQD